LKIYFLNKICWKIQILEKNLSNGKTHNGYVLKIAVVSYQPKEDGRRAHIGAAAPQGRPTLGWPL
jgi:hypothetical protein